MSTITAILEPDADGSLHLPLPPDLRSGKVQVIATLQRVPIGNRSVGAPKPGALRGFWMAPDFDEPLEDFQEYME